MGAIYMNSYVTLAADSSRSSDAGLFNMQSVLQDEAPLGKHLRLDVSTGDTGSKKGSRCNLYISSEFDVPKNIDPLGPVTITHDNDEDEDDPDESLVKRGWTLQEAVLPPRVLHFTSKQLIWECSQTGYEAEDTFSLNLRFLRPSFTEMKAKLMPQLENGEENDFFDPVRGLHASEINILKAWYWDLIEFRYSGRRLTYGIDKLPAIAGLADLASQTLDCEYIAGMWKKGIEWALTWRTLKAEAFTAEKKRHPYRSPSFSWACSNSLFTWSHALETFQRTAKVEDTHVELRCSRSPFGCLREGCRIRIAGWVSQQAVASHYDRRNALHFRIGGKRTGKIHMDRVPDDTETGGQAEPCSVVCIELGFGTGPNLETGFVETQPIPKELCLLVLTPIKGESECYTRFGYGELSWNEKSEDCIEYMGSREWRTITVY
ncbi:Heterokaryon incompatibility [Lasiodiplodia theobromae]|nr:Heterokaryon incompatibility [Lasiodiplodia theobromae]